MLFTRTPREIDKMLEQAIESISDARHLTKRETRRAALQLAQRILDSVLGIDEENATRIGRKK